MSLEITRIAKLLLGNELEAARRAKLREMQVLMTSKVQQLTETVDGKAFVEQHEDIIKLFAEVKKLIKTSKQRAG